MLPFLRVPGLGLVLFLLLTGTLRAQAPAPAAGVPLPPALQARLRAARTDSARYAVRFDAVRTYVRTLDSAGIVGNLHECRRLARHLGDSTRVGMALSTEGMY